MSLKQSSKDPRVSRDIGLDNPPACWGRERHRDCLRIETQAEVLLLPYQHLVSIRLRQQDQNELLNLTFSSHRVTLEGRHLNEIVMALQEFAVEWVAPIPARYQSLREANGATVFKVTVEEV